MSKTFLIIGIIVTGLSALIITIVSLSRFILKRIYKEEEKMKTREEKQKDKYVKRFLNFSKRVLKFINKRLLKSYLAFYGISATIATAGTVAIVTSSVQLVKEQKAMEDSTSLVSEDTSSEEVPSITSQSESVSSNTNVSESESLSGDTDTTESEPSSSILNSSDDSSTGDSAISTTYTVFFYVYDVLYDSVEVDSNMTVNAPGNDPYEDGFIFQYWSDTPGGSTQYDFSTAVTGNLNLYAYFLQECTVNYYYIMDLSDPLYTDTIPFDQLLDDYYYVPNSTSKTRLTWYYDQEGNDPVHFGADRATSSVINLFGIQED